MFNDDFFRMNHSDYIEVFSKKSSDNLEEGKTESIEMVNTSTPNYSLNLDELVSRIQAEVKSLLDKHNFDETVKYLDFQLPLFLSENKEILYLLQKMKFYHLLLNMNDTVKAEQILFSEMRVLGQSLKSNWIRKENSFIKLIKYPNILKNKDVIKNNIDKFMLVLNRSLFQFIYKLNNHETENSNQIDENTLLRFNSINLNSNFGNITSGYKSQSPIFLNNSGSLHNSNNIFNLSPSSQDHDSGSIYWNDNPNEECRQNLEEVKDLSRFSTKEEFSDFEDEIQLHENCIQHDTTFTENNQNVTSQSKNLLISPHNIINLNIENQSQSNNAPISCNPAGLNIKQDFIQFIENQNAHPIMNPINFQINKKNITTYENSNYNNIKNNIPIPTNSQYYTDLKLDKNSNFNVYSKDYIPKKKSEESWKSKLPMLKSFTPKYTKRENIDKKILRKFKAFLKDNHREKKVKNISQDKHFWLMFVNGNLFPPMNFQDNNTGEHIDFKSFNTKFLLWFFSKKGAKELYDLFMKEQSSNVLTSICEDYQVTKMEEINQLNTYINNMAYIFDIGALENGDKLLNSPPEPEKIGSTYSSKDKNLKNSIKSFGNSNSQDTSMNPYNKSIPKYKDYDSDKDDEMIFRERSRDLLDYEDYNFFDTDLRSSSRKASGDGMNTDEE